MAQIWTKFKIYHVFNNIVCVKKLKI